MMVIDSYCEQILGKESENIISVLPSGETPEELFLRMNILINEMFSELTEYSNADYRSGRALLLLVKKYCLSKKALIQHPC